MTERSTFRSAEEYLEAQPENTRKLLLELKACILEVAPNATELLNYGIPAYALTEGGKRDQQVMIAGFRNHVGLYPHPETIEKFKEDLKDLSTSKGTIRFDLDKPLPKDLIKRMISYRLQQLKNS